MRASSPRRHSVSLPMMMKSFPFGRDDEEPLITHPRPSRLSRPADANNSPVQLSVIVINTGRQRWTVAPRHGCHDVCRPFPADHHPGVLQRARTLPHPGKWLELKRDTTLVCLGCVRSHCHFAPGAAAVVLAQGCPRTMRCVLPGVTLGKRFQAIHHTIRRYPMGRRRCHAEPRAPVSHLVGYIG